MLVILLVIYCVGQFWAIFLRSGILAMLFSLIMTVALILWIYVMMFWEVPWWWSIAPWPVLLLLATRLRASAWLLERHNMRQIMLGRGAAAHAGDRHRRAVLSCFFRSCGESRFFARRVSSVAKTNPRSLENRGHVLGSRRCGSAPEKEDLESTANGAPQPEKKPDDEAQSEKKPNDQPWKPYKSLTAYDIAFVKKNQKAIDLALEASKRPECDFYADHPANLNSTPWFLFNWVLMRASQLEADGDLDAAWAHYLAPCGLPNTLIIIRSHRNCPTIQAFGSMPSSSAGRHGPARRPSEFERPSNNSSNFRSIPSKRCTG